MDSVIATDLQKQVFYCCLIIEFTTVTVYRNVEQLLGHKTNASNVFWLNFVEKQVALKTKKKYYNFIDKHAEIFFFMLTHSSLFCRENRALCEVGPGHNVNVHKKKSLIFCCYHDMCNHVDSPQTKDLLNNTLLGMISHLTNENHKLSRF
jgi:hypothetical protein